MIIIVIHSLTAYLTLQSGLEFNMRYWEVVREEFNAEIKLLSYIDSNLLSYIDSNPEPFFYAKHCHEASLAFAYALNKTITGKCYT